MRRLGESCFKSWFHKDVPWGQFEGYFRYAVVMELGYARVSTAKQDLDRQIDALRAVGIVPERIYVDMKSGATTDRRASICRSRSCLAVETRAYPKSMTTAYRRSDPYG